MVEGDDDQGCGGDAGDGGWVEADVAQGLELLEHGVGPLGWGSQRGLDAVVGGVVWAGPGALDRREHAGPGTLVALVRQGGHPVGRGLVQRGQGVVPGSSDVVGRTGLNRGRPHREPRVIGQDLDVAAEGFVQDVSTTGGFPAVCGRRRGRCG